MVGWNHQPVDCSSLSIQFPLSPRKDVAQGLKRLDITLSQSAMDALIHATWCSCGWAAEMFRRGPCGKQWLCLDENPCGWSSIQTGWWFGTCFIFHNIWDVNLPSDFHIFQRGRYNHQPAGKNREQTNFNERIPGLGWRQCTNKHNVFTVASVASLSFPSKIGRCHICGYRSLFPNGLVGFWNMNFIFLYIGNNHPNWLSYFFRGVGIPPIRGLSVYHIQQEIPVYPTKDWTLRLEIGEGFCIASPNGEFISQDTEGRYTRHHFNPPKKE